MARITIPSERSDISKLKGSEPNVVWWQFFSLVARELNKRTFTASQAAVSHTGDADSTLMATLPVQGFAYGIARLTMMFSCTNNANAKTVVVKLGNTTIQTIDIDASTATQSCQLVISGRGASTQYTDIVSSVNCSGDGGAATTVDISGNSTIAIYMQLGTITDTITLESWALEVEQA